MILVLHPEDPLDVREATRLAHALEELPPGARVHLDLSRVREVHATGLAALAFALDRDGGVTIGGLRRHDARLLAYLRAAPDAPAAEAGAADGDRDDAAERAGRSLPPSRPEGARAPSGSAVADGAAGA
jgi:hypothetical protein